MATEKDDIRPDEGEGGDLPVLAEVDVDDQDQDQTNRTDGDSRIVPADDDDLLDVTKKVLTIITLTMTIVGTIWGFVLNLPALWAQIGLGILLTVLFGSFVAYAVWRKSGP